MAVESLTSEVISPELEAAAQIDKVIEAVQPLLERFNNQFNAGQDHMPASGHERRLAHRRPHAPRRWPIAGLALISALGAGYHFYEAGSSEATVNESTIPTTVDAMTSLETTTTLSPYLSELELQEVAAQHDMNYERFVRSNHIVDTSHVPRDMALRFDSGIRFDESVEENRVLYAAEAGDTLSGLARALAQAAGDPELFGLKLDQLMLINPDANLEVGEEIILPNSVTLEQAWQAVVLLDTGHEVAPRLTDYSVLRTGDWQTEVRRLAEQVGRDPDLAILQTRSVNPELPDELTEVSVVRVPFLAQDTEQYINGGV